MISIKQWGEYRRFIRWCKKFDKNSKWAEAILNKYGQLGVDELKKRTPKDTGLTAESWTYTLEYDERGNASIVWRNDNYTPDGEYKIALLIYYGHATRSGVYVEGKDYINPALKKVIKKIGFDLEKEVFKIYE